MKLSIITINFNNCEGLRKTIESVVNQTWKEFEWIIVDGGSTDGSKELIEETALLLTSQGWNTENFSLLGFTAEDWKNDKHSIPAVIPQNPHPVPYLKWCSEKDNGVYNAMNKGVVKAQGDYLSFMNSGDTYYEEKTLELVFSMNLSSGIVYGDWIRVSQRGECSIAKSPQEITVPLLYQDNRICHQAMFINCSLFKEEGYDEQFHILGDWARWLKLACQGCSFQRISFPICRFMMGGLCCSNTEQKKKEIEMVRHCVPPHWQQTLELTYELQKKLSQYEDCIITRDSLLLIHEKRLYTKLLHLSLICIKGLRAIISRLNS